MIVKRAALPVAFLLLGVSGGLHGAVAQQAAEPGGWVLSETRSPVDYSPQIAAATTSRTPVAGLAPVLGVHCRRGRTEITLTTGIVPRRMPGSEVQILYQVGDPAAEQHWIGQRWIEQRLNEQRPGGGEETTVFTFKGDAVGFLRSLPDDGALFLRISDRQGEAQNLEFDLGGLRTVREKLAAACKWPSGSLPK